MGGREPFYVFPQPVHESKQQKLKLQRKKEKKGETATSQKALKIQQGMSTSSLRDLLFLFFFSNPLVEPWEGRQAILIDLSSIRVNLYLRLEKI